MMLLTVGIRRPLRYRDIAAAVTPDNADNNSAPFIPNRSIQNDRRSENFLVFIGEAGQNGFNAGKAAMD